jgi:hypothetical protein
METEEWYDIVEIIRNSAKMMRDVVGSGQANARARDIDQLADDIEGQLPKEENDG